MTTNGDDWEQEQEQEQETYTSEEAEDAYISTIQNAVDLLKSALTVNDFSEISEVEDMTVRDEVVSRIEKVEFAIALLEGALQINTIDSNE